nr:hypothetical protein [Acinetobacter bereziniae]
MNEFFLASNRSIYVHDLELKQITVKDLDQWSQFAEIIRKYLNNDYSKENIESIVKQHIVSAIMLCSFTTIYDVKYFSDLMNNEADDFWIFSEMFLM